MTDPLNALTASGVSVWLDDLDRKRLTSGNLAELVAEKHVTGVTTNPSIFHKAIESGASDYAAQIAELGSRQVSVDEAVRSLTMADVRTACDVLRPTWDATDGRDGHVSIEVDPRLAHNTDATIAEARALWWGVDRPNALIKIPATMAGLPAITAVLNAGISVNVTLIFSVERYRDVLRAWADGVSGAVRDDRDVRRLASVASFFVSRVDTAVDKRIDALGTPQAKSLRGLAALANARLAWAAFEKFVDTPEVKSLLVAGAQLQRPLWASTGVKDPTFPDTKYVTELVGYGTVNTMPEATLVAIADHGIVSGDKLSGMSAESAVVWSQLALIGIDQSEVLAELESAGVAAFERAWVELLASLADRLAENAIG